MGSELIQDVMPERVVQVEFSEVQRTPTGLARVVKASASCRLFLEKGCVVVRELVEEGGRKVVKSIGLPLNSGLVRTITFEDEVMGVDSTAQQPDRLQEAPVAGWRQSGVLQPPAVHLGGLAGLNGAPSTLLSAASVSAKNDATAESAKNLPSAHIGLEAQTAPAEPAHAPLVGHSSPTAGQEQGLSNDRLLAEAQMAQSTPLSTEERAGFAGQNPDNHVPASAEEAILNRRPRRR